MPPKSGATATGSIAAAFKNVNTVPATYSKRSRDRLVEANGLITDVHNAKEARELLMKDEYIEKDGGITPNKMAYALLRYTVGGARMSTATINFIRAIALMVEELDHDNAIGGITEAMTVKARDALAEQITVPIMQMETLLKDMKDQEGRVKEAITTVTETIDTLRRDVDQISTRVQGTETTGTQEIRGGADQQNEVQRTGTSYADVMRNRGGIPAEHAANR
jgi:hypothetical protein